MLVRRVERALKDLNILLAGFKDWQRRVRTREERRLTAHLYIFGSLLDVEIVSLWPKSRGPWVRGH